MSSLGFVAILAVWAWASPSHALPFADSVISFAGGRGFGVDDESPGTYAGEWGEGVFDPLAVMSLDGAVLGLGGAPDASGTPITPGAITMRFTTGEIIDGVGADLRLYDTFSFADGFNLDISSDGSSFSHAFSFAGDLTQFSCSLAAPCVTDVDISGTGLNAISYLRITAAGNSSQGFPEAYTLDAVEALNFQSLPVSEPGTLALAGMAAAALAATRRRKNMMAGE